MAITIVNEPSPFWPICNDVEWVFKSDETAQPNFSFTIELYIEGALHSTHEVYPEVGDGSIPKSYDGHSFKYIQR